MGCQNDGMVYRFVYGCECAVKAGSIKLKEKILQLSQRVDATLIKILSHLNERSSYLCGDSTQMLKLGRQVATV
jgi:hypothetical protein